MALGIGTRWLRPGQGNGLRLVALILAVAVFLQVTIIPRIDVGPIEGTPNLVVAAVVAIAAYRGVVVGAFAGFAGGLFVELLTPGDALGVLALAYVAVGAWCGRFAASPQPLPRIPAIGLVIVASVLVPVWVALIEILRGEGPPLTFVGRLVLPQLVCAVVMALPAWWAARRLLVTPREVEPWLVPA